MPPSHFNSKEVANRGQELYMQKIRAEVEIMANIGKQIVIDVETGDYEIDSDLVAAVRRLLRKRADAALWTAIISPSSIDDNEG